MNALVYSPPNSTSFCSLEVPSTARLSLRTYTPARLDALRPVSSAAMQFKVKNGTGAPIKVNSKGRVGKLNADMVDSKHAADLGVRTLAYEADINFTAVSQFVITLPNVPAGDYLATMDGWIYGPTGGWLYCRLAGIGGALEWTKSSPVRLGTTTPSRVLPTSLSPAPATLTSSATRT